MTTEDDFHRALDANPDDWQTRLVFADWLQERDDPRAEGYRALVAQARRVTCYKAEHGDWPWYNEALAEPGEPNQLPGDWFAQLEGGIQTAGGSRLDDQSPYRGKWLDWFSRRAAEDAAALAFSKLPAARRAYLLSGRRRLA